MPSRSPFDPPTPEELPLPAAAASLRAEIYSKYIFTSKLLQPSTYNQRRRRHGTVPRAPYAPLRLALSSGIFTSTQTIAPSAASDAQAPAGPATQANCSTPKSE